MVKFLIALALVAASTAQEFFEDSKVVTLGDDEWDAFVESNPKFLAMFYAPWCGHCKSLKPGWSEAAEELQYRIPMVAVDCQEGGETTCGKYGVKGFPTLKWFENGEAEDYSQGREVQAIINFVDSKVGDEVENFEGVDFNKKKTKELKKILHARGVSTKGLSEKKEFVKLVQESIHLPKVGPKLAKKSKIKGSSLVNGRTVAQERRYKAAVAAAEEGFGEDNGEVLHLIDDTWEAALKDHSKLLVTFWAPWCGFCKQVKPELVAVSKTAKETDPDMTIAAVECDTNPETCSKILSGSGYPTIKYFTEGGPAKGVMYDGARDAKGFAKWIVKTLRPDDYVPEKFVNDDSKWDPNGAVVHLTDDHFEEFRKENPQMLVVFYAPWCGHCKAIKPAYAEASTEVENFIFAAVDCTEESQVCDKFGVKGYPTIMYFASSDDEGEEFNGGRDAADFVSFAKARAPATDNEHEEL